MALKGKFWRIAKRVVLALVILLIIVLVIGRIMLPGVIRSQGEKIATDMLGTEVKIADVDLSILGGSATLKGFSIRQHEGFKDEFMVEFAEAGANVGLLSLMSNTIVVEDVHVASPRLRMEVTADGRQSLAVFIETMQKRMAEKAAEVEEVEEAEEEVEEEAAGKSILVERIRVTDAEVVARNAQGTPQPLSTTIKLADFDIKDLYVPAEGTKPGVRPMTLAAKGFSLSAPEGFTDQLLFEVADAGLGIDMGSLVGDTLKFSDIQVTGTRVNLETLKDGRQSLGTLLDTLMAQAPKPPVAEEEPVAGASTESAPNPEGEADKPPATADAPSAEAADKSILVEQIHVVDTKVVARNAQGTPQPLSTTMMLADFDIKDLYVPAAGSNPGSKPMTLTAKGFSLTAPEGFSDPVLLEVADAGVIMDMGSLAGDTITIDDVHATGTRVRVETLKDKRQSLRTLLDIFMAQAPKAPAGEEPAATVPEGETTSAPSEGAPEEPAKATLVKQVRISDVEITARDAYAADDKIDTTLTLGQASISEIHIPIPGAPIVDRPMTLSVAGMKITAPERFAEDVYFDLKSFEMQFELPRMMATMEKPEIVIPLIRQDGLRLVAEQFEDEENSAAAQNIMESSRAFANGFAMQDPVTMEEAAEAAKQAEADAAKAEEQEEEGLVSGLLSKAGEARDKLTGEEQAEVPPPPVEEPAFKEIFIKRVEVTDCQTMNLLHRDDERLIYGTRTNLTMDDVVYPFRDDMRTKMESTVTPVSEWSESGTMTMTMVMGGATLDTRFLDMKLETTTFPIYNINRVSKGTMTSSTVAKIENRRLTGSSKVKMEDFDYLKQNKGVMGFDQLELVKTFSRSGVPISMEINPPIELKDEYTMQDYGLMLLSTLAGSLANNLGALTGAAGSLAEDSAKKLGTLGDDLGDALKTGDTEAVEDELNKVGDELNKVGEGLQGLFGKKKEEDKK